MMIIWLPFFQRHKIIDRLAFVIHFFALFAHRIQLKRNEIQWLKPWLFMVITIYWHRYLITAHHFQVNLYTNCVILCVCLKYLGNN